MTGWKEWCRIARGDAAMIGTHVAGQDSQLTPCVRKIDGIRTAGQEAKAYVVRNTNITKQLTRWLNLPARVTRPHCLVRNISPPVHLRSIVPCGPVQGLLCDGTA